MEKRIFDISPALTPSIAVWPGDTPLSREVLLDMKRGDNVTLGSMRATVHLGAHADAHSHYSPDGQTIESRDLSIYLGPCRVIRVDVPRGTRIEVTHLTSDVTAPRILFSTGTYPDPRKWNENFAALSPELVDWLHERGVILVGIDTPSVDLFESKDLPAHNRFLAHDMAILECLALADVPEGNYELIALPLKLVGFDASPVRAILRAI